EYSSIRFGMFFLSEFMNTITMSAIIVTLFFGGPAGPSPFGPAALWGLLWFMAKLLVFLFVFVWLRATLPRFRYDQLMDLGWKRLIPVALGWLLLLGAIRLGRDEQWIADSAFWTTLVVLVAGLFIALLCGLAILSAIRTADRRRLDPAEVMS
ncbi:MAG: NADH-quinone oxidoreductase subunit H, partial [Acidimicrobiia bacterium]|nr:NADH-quinone oxidoreductase subunit H [Acidimicrobiia bacterium]